LSYQSSLQVNLTKLWGFISVKRKKQFLGVFALMLAASFAEIVSIGAVLPFLGALANPEKIFSSPATHTALNFFDIKTSAELLLPLTALFCLATLFSGGIRLVLLWATTKLSFATGADLSIGIYRKALYQPYSTHISRNSSEVITGISSKASAVVGQIITPILVATTSIIILVTVLTALLWIEPTIAILAFIGFGLIYFVIAKKNKKTLEQNSRIIASNSTQAIKALQEGLGGIRDVLIDGSQEVYCGIYEKANLSLLNAQGNNQYLSSAPRYLMEAFGMTLIAVLALILSMRADGVGMVIPVLGALALGAQRLLPVLQQLYGAWSVIKGSQEILGDIVVLLEQPMPENWQPKSPKLIKFDTAIKLEALSFRYSKSTPWVLKDVDLLIKKGSRVGIIGSTGSGKSTLLDVVMALLTPSLGCIKIDGVEVTAKNRREWQSRIAHVPQSIFLADTTVAENIAFGLPIEDIDFDRLELAASKAQIATTIRTWDKGYFTEVGERGVRLSGGQRQRIGIARALYRDASVIILDEATSALDGATESSVMECVDSSGADLTFLIIAHRLSTLRNCDKVVELDNGEIRREGSYAEIIKNVNQTSVN
jgi:ABC-type multidrug transport system fused ATPase/permease subunit